MAPRCRRRLRHYKASRSMADMSHSVEADGTVPKHHTGHGQENSSRFRHFPLCEDTPAEAVTRAGFEKPRFRKEGEGRNIASKRRFSFSFSGCRLCCGQCFHGEWRQSSENGIVADRMARMQRVGWDMSLCGLGCCGISLSLHSWAWVGPCFLPRYRSYLLGSPALLSPH